MRHLSSALLLGAIAWSFNAHAQTHEVTLSWEPSTQHTDGTAITGLVTYNLYAGISGQAANRVQANITGTSVKRTAIPANVWCWHVRAVVNGVESDPSQIVCADFTAPKKPKSPVNVRFNPSIPNQVAP